MYYCSGTLYKSCAVRQFFMVAVADYPVLYQSQVTNTKLFARDYMKQAVRRPTFQTVN